MSASPIPDDEVPRLRALHDLDILDTAPTREFDTVIALACSIFSVPIALVSIVDASRQWFKARCGLDVSETGRDVAFCAHAIMSDEVMVVPDALSDPRFRDNPLVLGPPYIRFYAGVPVKFNGRRIGTLCIIDAVPRTLPPQDRERLRALGVLTENLVAAHARVAELEAARAQGDRLARLVELAANQIVVMDLDRRITYANTAFCAALGRLPSELTGRSVAEVLHFSEAQEDAWASACARAVQGEQAQIETMRTTADGSPLTLSVTFSPLYDKNGTVVGIASLATDISERMRHEREIAAYAGDLERFSHVASHDLQEPLRKIATHTRLLVQAAAAGDTAEMERCSQVLNASCERGRDLVAALLRYSQLKGREIEKQPVPLDEVIIDLANTWQEAGESLPPSIQVDLPPLWALADRYLIAQVFQNLIENAVKYRKTGEAAQVEISSEFDRHRSCLWIRVSDSGIGFEMAHSEVIFVPFQRLVMRGQYTGSGIGLSLVKSVLDAHGWAIDVQSAPGVGSTFSIGIPSRDLCAADATSGNLAMRGAA